MRPEPFEEKLLAYLDGSMASSEKKRFETWLREHPDEARRVRQHQQVDQLLGTLDGEEWGREQQTAFADRVIQRSREPDPAPVMAGPTPARWRSWTVIAAAAAVVIAAWVLWPSDPGAATVVPGPEEVAVPADVDELLTDPDFIAHFDLLRHMTELEDAGVLLDLPETDTFDVVNLEVLAGV